jgi:hypothetical protein
MGDLGYIWARSSVACFRVCFLPSTNFLLSRSNLHTYQIHSNQYGTPLTSTDTMAGMAKDGDAASCIYINNKMGA